MIRDNLSADASNVALLVTGGDRIRFQRRTDTGATTSTWSGSQTLPYWIRLVRNGDTFEAYRSSNGVDWTPFAHPVTVSMTGDVYVGLAMTSHDNSVLGTATFDNVAGNL